MHRTMLEIVPVNDITSLAPDHFVVFINHREHLVITLPLLLLKQGVDFTSQCHPVFKRQLFRPNGFG